MSDEENLYSNAWNEDLEENNENDEQELKPAGTTSCQVQDVEEKYAEEFKKFQAQLDGAAIEQEVESMRQDRALYKRQSDEATSAARQDMYGPYLSSAYWDFEQERSSEDRDDGLI